MKRVTSWMTFGSLSGPKTSTARTTSVTSSSAPMSLNTCCSSCSPSPSDPRSVIRVRPGRSTVPGRNCPGGTRSACAAHVPVRGSRGSTVMDRSLPLRGQHGQVQAVARAVGADLHDQLLAAVHPLAVHLGDDVARLDARPSRRDRPVSPRACRRRPSSPTLAPSPVYSMSSVTPITGWVALPVLISSSATRLPWLIGMAKPRPMEPAWPPSGRRAAVGGADGAVDADDVGLGVDQRAAGVARVDRGVGLQRVHVADVAAVALLAARGDGPVLGADDAGGDGVGQVEGGADGHDRVADLHVVGVAQRQRLEPADAARP